MDAMSSIPTPTHLFEAINAHQRSAAIRTAIELDLFSSIGAEAAAAGQIAEACKGSVRGVTTLCNCLVSLGFLEKHADVYSATMTARMFLDRRSPAYMGDIVTYLLHDSILQGFDRLTDTVRLGGDAADRAPIAADTDVWVKFARAMAPSMALLAKLVRARINPKDLPVPRVLELAAGHGMFGIEFARGATGCEVTALDWPDVLEVARENAEQAGVLERYSLLPGDVLETEFGDGFGLVMLPNILHLFDHAECVDLLKRVHAALVPGGTVAIIDFVLNENRTSPDASVFFALMMLATTTGGTAYTASEFTGMLIEAGFNDIESQQLFPADHSLITATR